MQYFFVISVATYRKIHRHQQVLQKKEASNNNICGGRKAGAHLHRHYKWIASWCVIRVIVQVITYVLWFKLVVCGRAIQKQSATTTRGILTFLHHFLLQLQITLG